MNALRVHLFFHSYFALMYFTLCFRIAKSQHYDSEGLIDIFRQYGDHLYTKGDHNAAIEQYIKTIGKLEPSYVIRKVWHVVLESFMSAFILNIPFEWIELKP
jgi:hypothetical protein